MIIGTVGLIGLPTTLAVLFPSGAALPLEQLPDTLRDVSDFIPLTYVVTLVQDLWIGEGWNRFAVAVLAGVLALSVVVSARTFRWE